MGAVAELPEAAIDSCALDACSLIEFGRWEVAEAWVGGCGAVVSHQDQVGLSLGDQNSCGHATTSDHTNTTSDEHISCHAMHGLLVGGLWHTMEAHVMPAAMRLSSGLWGGGDVWVCECVCGGGG